MLIVSLAVAEAGAMPITDIAELAAESPAVFA
jgi:hypothetical protein